MLPELTGGSRRWRLWGLVLIGAAQAIATLAAALATSRLYHAALAPAHSGTAPIDSALILPAALLVTSIIVQALLQRSGRVQSEALGQHFVNEARQASYARLAQLSTRTRGSSRQGTLMLRLTGDLTALRQWVSQGVARLLVRGTLLVGCFAGLTILAPALGLAAILVAVVFGLALLVRMRTVDRSLDSARRQRGRLAGEIGELLQNLATTNLLGRRGRDGRRVKKLSSRLADAMIERARQIGGVLALAHLAAGGVGLAVLLTGVVLQRTGAIGAPELLTAITVAALCAAPIVDLARVFEVWRAGRLARAQLAALLAAGPLVRQPSHRRSFDRRRPDIAFIGTSLEGSLKPLTAAIPFGTRLVIEGPAASGKSTLLQLMVRLADPTEGEVRVGGSDVRQVGLGALRRAVCLVSPEIGLSRGTVASNLAASGIDPLQRRDEWERCGIAGGPDSGSLHLQRVVGERGRDLSSGERLRVVLARALCLRPRVLLLDDVDSQLDEVGRDILRNILRDFDGTVILATSSAQWRHVADTVWLLRAGHLEILEPARGPAAVIELDKVQRRERGS
jgi:ATP-binding cassette, subfamily B, bacterial